jgi:hypothetical protein
MGIPRKGSRRIDVDGRAFRYLVKETHIPDHKDQKESSLTVQEDTDRPGRVLQARVAYGAPVTPETVREFIRRSLRSGWDPSTRGPAVTLGYPHPSPPWMV